ncbi:hypothetical protein TIFTF001_001776 [Ficus carica]|uniref:Uncharacterized protein n=1 Tax=Ficus carica TaxID=3494 RepID=A0AA87ZQ80_FICCA|nr:hypothetical protein TIFTF001_001776 [Ficus carica]
MQHQVQDAIESTQDSQEHGKTSAQARSFFYFLLQEFNSCSILLLFVSAGLLFAIEIIERGPEYGWHDGSVVLFAIFLLVSSSSVGNFRRERKRVKRIWKDRNKLEVKVERNGKPHTVSICDVKVFDTVHLKKGDQIPANGVYVEGENLTLDEPVLFNSKQIDRDRNPFLFSGSRVVEGNGSMIVTSIRSNMDVGLSFHDLERKTLLQSLLDKPNGYIEKFTLSMSLLIAFVVLLRLLFKKHDKYSNELPEMKGHLTMKFLMQIFERLVLRPQGRVSILASTLATCVIAIQHGMPFVVGVSLSYSSDELANEGDFHNLSACCTMGLVTVFIIDATGDFLCKRMEVKEFWIGEKDIIDSETDQSVVIGPELRQGIGVWVLISPTDDFLFSCISRSDTRDTSNDRYRVLEYKRTSSSGKEGCEALMRKIDDEEEEQSIHHWHWKGPPSTILKMCRDYYDNRGERHDMGSDQKRMFENVIENMQKNGLRPIAFAYGQTEVREIKNDGLSLLAIAGLKYPCKEEIKSLVEALRGAGSVIKLASEDELPVVKCIAWELGFEPGSNDEQTEAKNIRGRMLDDRIAVIGNSNPEDKCFVVEKLQEKGHVVAYYGGAKSKDTLTLKKADLGITQGNKCSEMAKKFSDISLKNRPDLSLIQIKKRGGLQYRNIQKFYQLQLTASISGLTITLVSTMHAGESPLTSVHMIWMNLILCLLGGLMMVMELNGEDVQLAKRTESLITKAVWTNVAIQVCYQVTLLLIFGYFVGKYASAKIGKDVWDTMIFNTFIFCQLINLLNVINLANKEVSKIVLRSYWFVMAFVAVLVSQALAVQLGKGLLCSEKLNVIQWTCCFLLAAFSSLFDWVMKWLLPLFPDDKMESISHAILDCPTSRAVWKVSRFWKVVENRRDFPFADFLRIVKSKIPLEDFALVCWLAWKLWCERNKVLHQVPVQSQVVGSDVWLPPQSGYLKLNVDALVSPGSDHIGIGVVIHDEKGRILGAMAKSVDGTFSPFLAECIVLREGLMMAKELESVTLVVETDTINVVSAVSDNTEFFFGRSDSGGC